MTGIRVRTVALLVCIAMLGVGCSDQSGTWNDVDQQSESGSSAETGPAPSSSRFSSATEILDTLDAAPLLPGVEDSADVNCQSRSESLDSSQLLELDVRINGRVDAAVCGLWLRVVMWDGGTALGPASINVLVGLDASGVEAGTRRWYLENKCNSIDESALDDPISYLNVFGGVVIAGDNWIVQYPYGDPPFGSAVAEILDGNVLTPREVCRPGTTPPTTAAAPTTTALPPTSTVPPTTLPRPTTTQPPSEVSCSNTGTMEFTPGRFGDQTLEMEEQEQANVRFCADDLRTMFDRRDRHDSHADRWLGTSGAASAERQLMPFNIGDKTKRSAVMTFVSNGREDFVRLATLLSAAPDEHGCSVLRHGWRARVGGRGGGATRVGRGAGVCRAGRVAVSVSTI